MIQLFSAHKQVYGSRCLFDWLKTAGFNVGCYKTRGLMCSGHEAVSFESPEYIADSIGLGALRKIEALCILDNGKLP